MAGVYERVPGSNIWPARIRVKGKLVPEELRAQAGRADAIAWVEKARTFRRTGEGVLPSTTRRPALTTAEVAVLGDPDAITVGRLCDEFLRYVKTHPQEYRDLVYPPRRGAQIRKVFGERKATSLRASEIENWLDEIREQRDLENSTINKMRGTFSMIYKHGRRKDLVDVNPAADVPLWEVGNWKEKFLSAEEERRLREVLQRHIDSHDPIVHPELRKQAIHRLLEFEGSR